MMFSSPTHIPRCRQYVGFCKIALALLFAVCAAPSASADQFVRYWKQGAFAETVADGPCKLNEQYGCPDFVWGKLKPIHLPKYNIARGVGILIIDYKREDGQEAAPIEATCTGSVIARDAVLTNYHCIKFRDKNDVVWRASRVRLVMDYQKHGDLENWDYVYSVEPIALKFKEKPQEDPAKDFVILRVIGRDVRGAPLAVDDYVSNFGVVPLEPDQPTKEDLDLFIVHHGGHLAKLHQSGCQIFANDDDWPVGGDPRTTNIMRHRCSTDEGSSGALIFRAVGLDNYKVLALHKAGWPHDVGNLNAFNTAVPINYIIESSGRGPDGRPIRDSVWALDYLVDYWRKHPPGKGPPVPSLTSEKRSAGRDGVTLIANNDERWLPLRLDQSATSEQSVLNGREPCEPYSDKNPGAPPYSNVIGSFEKGSDRSTEFQITGFRIRGTIVCQDGYLHTNDDVDPIHLIGVLPQRLQPSAMPGPQNWRFEKRRADGVKKLSAGSSLVRIGSYEVSYERINSLIWRTKTTGREFFPSPLVRLCANVSSDSFSLPGGGLFRTLEYDRSVTGMDLFLNESRCLSGKGALALKSTSERTRPLWEQAVAQNMIATELDAARALAPHCGSEHDDARCTIHFDRAMMGGGLVVRGDLVKRRHVAQSVPTVTPHAGPGGTPYYRVEFVECEYNAALPEQKTVAPQKLCDLVDGALSEFAQLVDPIQGLVCESRLTREPRDGWVEEDTLQLVTWPLSCNRAGQSGK